MRNSRLVHGVLLPAVLMAVGTITFLSFRTTLQLDTLRRQSVLEATLGLALEKATRLEQQIIAQDNVIRTLADPTDPAELALLAERWLPTATHNTPTVRAIGIFNSRNQVVAFAVRPHVPWSELITFRRLLMESIQRDMDLTSPLEQTRHLHAQYEGQDYLVSYWHRMVEKHPYLVVAWHDVERIAQELLPRLYKEDPANLASRVNVVDEHGKILFGPLLQSGLFLVSVPFPTTLYDWHLQISPAASEALAQRIQKQRLLELSMLILSSLVIAAGVLTILFVAEKQKRVSAFKSEFVANVSHELQTPLALIRMFGEMLSTDRVTTPHKRREYLSIIVHESERLSSLIANVLNFAKAERSRSSASLVMCDVRPILLDVVNVHRCRAEQQEIALLLDLPETLPSVPVDVQAVHLALSNLVDNALKYASESREITVSAHHKGETILLQVFDQGPGLDEEEQERVFERFVRGSKAHEIHKGAAIRGTGIGLALVRRIAEIHGGKAWVSRNAGGGCVFSFSLSINFSRKT